MKFDQYEEPNQEQAELVKAVGMLVAALYDEEGEAKDLADREGRKALQQAIDRFPREIPADLREEDKNVLKCVIEECRETRKMMKMWFWWIVGAMFLASATMTLCAVMMLR